MSSRRLIFVLVVKSKKFVDSSFYCFFIKSFLVLYFAVFVRIKQIVKKICLKYATGHRIEVLYPIFYHPYICKITVLSLLWKTWTKWKNLLVMSLKASSSFLDKFLQALRLNLIFTRVVLLLVLVICSVPSKVFSITFLSSWIINAFKPSRPS